MGDNLARQLGHPSCPLLIQECELAKKWSRQKGLSRFTRVSIAIATAAVAIVGAGAAADASAAVIWIY